MANQVKCTWQEKLKFISSADGHEVPMDSKPPLGDDTAMTPKQLMLASICGCTGMDVAALMRKYRQPVQSLAVEADATTEDRGHPIVFSEIRLAFRFKGELDPARVIEAVQLSQTKYCGVSAMISRGVPIRYEIDLNGSVISTGSAKFD